MTTPDFSFSSFASFSSTRAPGVSVPLASMLVLVGTVTGCAYRHQTKRLLPEGFEPIRPTFASSDPTDEHDSIDAAGHDEGGFWSDAKMIVHASAAEVCAALRRPEVVVNDGTVSSWKVVDDDSFPYDDDGFVIENTVDRVVTIRYRIGWKFVDAPDHGGGCLARWGLVSAPSFIETNRGWVQIEPLGEGRTRVSVQAEIEAPRIDEGVPLGYLRLLGRKLREAVRRP